MMTKKLLSVSLLMVLLVACQQAVTPFPTPTVTQPSSMVIEQTAVWEKALAETIADIQAAQPPQRPDATSCTLHIPEPVSADYNERFLIWAQEQIANGALDELAKHGVVVYAGNPDAKLIISPLYGCHQSSHDNAGAKVSVLDNAGNLWSMSERVGIPIFEHSDQQIMWDGEKWILLVNQQFAYWGMSSSHFVVWHITPNGDSWRTESFELPNNPAFSWVNSQPPTIELDGQTHFIAGSLANIESPCTFTPDFDAAQYRKGVRYTYIFTESGYEIYGKPHYFYQQDDGSQILDWEKYCMENVTVTVTKMPASPTPSSTPTTQVATSPTPTLIPTPFPQSTPTIPPPTPQTRYDCQIATGTDPCNA